MSVKAFKEMNEMNENDLMIVDSLNLGFRWSHSGATDFKDQYMDTVSSLRRSYKCGKVVILGDAGSSYRKSIYPEYKANRAEKYKNQTEAENQKFYAFLEEMNLILDAYREETDFPVFKYKGIEADDFAAYIVKNRKRFNINNIWLISSDGDYDLLINEHVSRFSYVTRKEITLDTWYDRYDYSPEDHISIKTLMGDTGDNIMGVSGVGPKKAQALVEQYGSIYDIMEALPINSKYKYIQNLNEFGVEGLTLNLQLMDLLEYCEEAIGIEIIKEVDAKMKEYMQC
jgi:5'-3' exonuclease